MVEQNIGNGSAFRRQLLEALGQEARALEERQEEEAGRLALENGLRERALRNPEGASFGLAARSARREPGNLSNGLFVNGLRLAHNLETGDTCPAPGRG